MFACIYSVAEYGHVGDILGAVGDDVVCLFVCLFGREGRGHYVYVRAESQHRGRVLVSRIFMLQVTGNKIHISSRVLAG